MFGIGMSGGYLLMALATGVSEGTFYVVGRVATFTGGVFFRTFSTHGCHFVATATLFGALFVKLVGTMAGGACVVTLEASFGNNIGVRVFVTVDTLCFCSAGFFVG